MKKNHKNFGVQFYPTTVTLTEQLLDRDKLGRPLYEFRSKLDPCAGAGFMADYAAEGKFLPNEDERRYFKGIDVCEIDPDLAKICTGKKHRVVSYDFLSYYPRKLYDLIVMNPPFRIGAKMVMHAWDILDSGTVAAIVNANTILKPSTADAQRLVDLIDMFEFEYLIIEDAFGKDADRKAKVDVALVWLHKPEKASLVDFDPTMFQLDGKTDVADLEQTFLISTSALTAIVASHNAAANAIIEKYKIDQKLAHYVGMLNDGGVVTDIETLNESLSELSFKYWDYVLTTSNVAGFLTTKVKHDFERDALTLAQLSFCEENIKIVIDEFMIRRDELMKICTIEVFDAITRLSRTGNCDSDKNRTEERWLTNDSHKVGMKIISTKGFSYRQDWQRWSIEWSGSMNPHGYQEASGIEFWADLDKAICFAAGVSYVDDMVVGTDQALKDHIDNIKSGKVYFTDWTESDFFTFRIFKKGTIHLKWKSKDLCDMFNWAAARSKGWTGLPWTGDAPSEIKKKQKRQKDGDKAGGYTRAGYAWRESDEKADS